jgi:uncharacterized damage-inducible protein DinB
VTTRHRLVLDPVGATDPEVGRWLAALEEVRRDTLAVVDAIPADAIDGDPGDGGDTLGTVLYHIALVEIDWVFTDVLDREDDISRELIPYDSREGDGRLTPILGETIADHLERLATVRGTILGELRSMTPEDYHRVREREEIDVSADWVVFHLIDHEVEHRVRISALRDAFSPT